MVGFNPERARAAAKKPRVTRKATRFRQQYMAQQWTDPVEAARIVGYQFPEKEAPKLLEKLEHLIEQDKDEFRRSEHMDSVEVQQWLAKIGRGQIRASTQQVTALQLVARINGLIDAELNLNFSRRDVEKALEHRTSELLTHRAPLALDPPKES